MSTATANQFIVDPCFPPAFVKAWMEKTISEQALEETEPGRAARAILRARRDGRPMDDELRAKFRPLIDAVAGALEEADSSEEEKPVRRPGGAQTRKRSS